MLDLKKLLTKIITAISGKVSKTGDTMTGNLQINNKIINMHSDNVTSKVVPSTGRVGDGFIQFSDSNGTDIGRLFFYVNTAGYEGMFLQGIVYDGSTRKINEFRIGFDPNLNQHVYMSHPSAWRSGLGLTRTIHSVSKNSSFNASTWSFAIFKYVDFAFLKFNINVPALTANTWYTMCDISSVCHPTESVWWTLAGQVNAQYLIEISAAGVVRILSNSNTTQQFLRGFYPIPI